MPVDATTQTAMRVRTHYELRQIITLKGGGPFVSRRYFDEDEKVAALQTHAAWENTLPLVGIEKTMSTDDGNEYTGEVTSAVVELYVGKVEITGTETWRWLGPPKPFEGAA